MAQQPNFGFLVSTEPPLKPPVAESPFRIAVLADFTGRANRGLTESGADLAGRRPHHVTRDALDDLMARLGVALNLPVGEDGDVVTLEFSSLDDFHPDQVHDKVERFGDLYDSDEKTELMRALLHHPDFQALEATWRGLDWLLRRAQKGGQVEVVLFDLARDELAADLTSSEDLTTCALYQTLIEKGVRGQKGQPWALLVGDYLFEPTAADADLLGRLARIAAQTDAPFLAGAAPVVHGPDFAPDAAAWSALRRLPEATLLGLAAPRFLLRRPYGEDTQSIDRFSFEEATKPPEPGQYLFGNAALGCAALIAQAFHKQGWGCKPGAVLDLDDMPIHVYTVDDEEEFTLAEAWLRRPELDRLVKLGIMPFLGARDRGALQLMRFLSLAQPPKDQPGVDLRGRWGQAGVGPASRGTMPPAAKVGFGFGDKQFDAPPPAVAPPAAAPPAAVKPEANGQAAAAEESAPADPAADEAMDSELAALMQQMEAPAAAPEENPADQAAEQEMDSELADLMKQMEGAG